MQIYGMYGCTHLTSVHLQLHNQPLRDIERMLMEEVAGCGICSTEAVELPGRTGEADTPIYTHTALDLGLPDG